MRDELLLYDLTDSPFCAKVRICLQVKGLAYRRITLTVNNRKELRAANPLGKVPVLIDRGRSIADSSAIARHLEAEHPEPPLLPGDPAARAYVSLLEDWADESLYFVVGGFKWLNPANRAKAVERTMSELGGGVFRPVVGRLVARHRVELLRGGWRDRSRLRGPDAREPRPARRAGGGPDVPRGCALTIADIAVRAARMDGAVRRSAATGQPAVGEWLARLDEIPAVATRTRRCGGTVTPGGVFRGSSRRACHSCRAGFDGRGTPVARATGRCALATTPTRDAVSRRHP
jgi:glutathione S-transferase